MTCADLLGILARGKEESVWKIVFEMGPEVWVCQ